MKKLLVVSNMYPSPIDPSFGIFVRRQVRALQSLGIDCKVVASTSRGGTPAASLGKYGELSRRAWLAAGSHPDAVLAHYVFPTGAIGLAAARRARAPLAVVAHGGDVSAERSGAFLGAAREVLRRADVVLAVSLTVADEAAALGAAPERITVASMGYDEEIFFPRDRSEARQALGIEAGRPCVAFVGNLIKRKGIGVLIEAAARLRSLVPDLRWLIVGGGAERPAWEDRARAKGVTDIVRFVGPVAPDDVGSWIAAADIFVVPSLREPLGVAALEALACGVPVIASRTGGLAEIMSEPSTGVLVEPGDADELAGAIVRVLGDQALREQLRMNGPRAAAPHTVVRQAERVLDALARIAG